MTGQRQQLYLSRYSWPAPSGPRLRLPLVGLAQEAVAPDEAPEAGEGDDLRLGRRGLEPFLAGARHRVVEGVGPVVRRGAGGRPLGVLASASGDFAEARNPQDSVVQDLLGRESDTLELEDPVVGEPVVLGEARLGGEMPRARASQAVEKRGELSARGGGPLR